jgi:DNA adenine methylase
MSWAEIEFPAENNPSPLPPAESTNPVSTATNGKALHPTPTEAPRSVELSSPPAADPPLSPDRDLLDSTWDGVVLTGHTEQQPDGTTEIVVESVEPFSVPIDERPETAPIAEFAKPTHDPDAMLAIFRSLDRSEQVRENYTRAPLGYPGSKSRSIGQILPNLPYRKTYCEPFGGSGSVLLARHSCDLEVYNDRYGGIVAFYRCLRDPQKWIKLRELVDLSVHSREEFIWCKESWNSQDVTDDVDRAYRWYYMHQNSFGQQERNFGRAGKGGKAQHGNALRNNAKMFAAAHYRLKNVLIENLDWRQILTDFDHPENVFYLDPPYVKFAKGIYRHNMTVADHREMCERIQQLESFVALSGYYDPETVELYGRYEWDRVLTWNISSSAVAMAFTETNNRAGHEDTIRRHKTVEGLWIREAPR